MHTFGSQSKCFVHILQTIFRLRSDVFCQHVWFLDSDINIYSGWRTAEIDLCVLCVTVVIWCGSCVCSSIFCFDVLIQKHFPVSGRV